MASPIVNTKVERVIDAFENMALAVAAAQSSGTGVASKKQAHADLVAARTEAADALRECLAPVIRVATVNGERVA